MMTVAERKRGNRVGAGTCTLVGTDRAVEIDPAYAGLEDFALVEKIKAGDRGAREALVLRHYPMLRNIAKKMAMADTESEKEYIADILLSDAVAKMLQIVGGWEPSLGGLTTYLHFAIRRELLRTGCELRGVISVRQAAFMPGRREKMAHLVEQARKTVRVENTASGVSTWGTRRLRRPSDRADITPGPASADLLGLKGERLEIVLRVLERMRRQGGQAALCAEVLMLRARGATLDGIAEIIGRSRGRVDQLEKLAFEMVCVELGRPLPWSKPLGYAVREALGRRDAKAGARLRRLRERRKAG